MANRPMPNQFTKCRKSAEASAEPINRFCSKQRQQQRQHQQQLHLRSSIAEPIDSPSRLHCCANVHCINDSCFAAIQDEYDNLVRQVSNADKFLPRHKPGVQKSWWTVSPTQDAILHRAANSAAAAIEIRKSSKICTYFDNCRAQGIVFQPLVVKTFGGWDRTQ